MYTRSTLFRYPLASVCEYVFLVAVEQQAADLGSSHSDEGAAPFQHSSLQRLRRSRKSSVLSSCTSRSAGSMPTMPRRRGRWAGNAVAGARTQVSIGYALAGSGGAEA